MRSLFAKIFLWFWLAMVLIGGVILTFSAIEHARWEDRGGGFREFMRGHVEPNAELAIYAWERGGKDKLLAQLKRIRDRGSAGWLFDSSGRELSGREVAPEVVAASTAPQEPEQRSNFFDHGLPRFHRSVMAGSDGATYTFVMEMIDHPRPPSTEPAFLISRLVAVILTAGGVCYALARYLTRPLRRLRTAVQNLAAGDLDARAGAVGRRHDEFGQLSRDFDIMAERLQSLVSAQQRLLRDVSHELRSPLSRLNVALELTRQAAAPTLTTSLDRIARESERLNELISQILTLVRLEGGAMPQQRVAVDLAALTREVVNDADFEAAAHDRHVRLLTVDECVISGAPGLLRSALENIIRNAAQYTRSGTTVEVSLRRDRRDDRDAAIVEIRDYGPGVPETALRDIFRPFYRVADARERETGGVGLGLAIAERAIISHGGVVSAENADGGGLRVRIELPIGAAG